MDYNKIKIMRIRRWDTREIEELYRAGGWWDLGYCNETISDMIKNSFIFVIAADDNGHAVGTGRVISDTCSDGYIQDVAVFPEYRNNGIGSRIVKALKRLSELEGLSWIGLVSAPGKENFYRNIGFSEMKKYTPMLSEERR